MPFKKKKYNSRFPVGRIKKIIQTDEDIGKVAQAVPVIISKTLELFLESLIKKSLDVSRMKSSRVLGPHHVKQCIFSERRFDFLRDLVKDVPEVSQEDDSYDDNNHHPSRRESNEFNDDEMDDKDDYNSDTDGDEDM